MPPSSDIGARAVATQYDRDMGGFDFDGAKYRLASVHLQRQWGSRLIDSLTPAPDAAILDLGCGDGAVTRELATLVPDGRVVGVDASPGMITVAREFEGGNLEFVQLDIGDLYFADEFDVIFSNAALHWVTDHPRLLANCLRALRPGGLIRWSFGGDGNCVNLIRCVRAAMGRDPYAEHFEHFAWPWFMPSVAEYSGLLTQAGFRTLHLELVNLDRAFTAEQLTAWIDQPCLVPFLQPLPIELRDGFRDLVVESMLRQTRQPDGTYFETFRRIDLAATESEKS